MRARRLFIRSIRTEGSLDGFEPSWAPILKSATSLAGVAQKGERPRFRPRVAGKEGEIGREGGQSLTPGAIPLERR